MLMKMIAGHAKIATNIQRVVVINLDRFYGIIKVDIFDMCRDWVNRSR